MTATRRIWALASGGLALAFGVIPAQGQGVVPPMVHETRNAEGAVIGTTTMDGCRFSFEASGTEGPLSFETRMQTDMADLRMFETETVVLNGEPQEVLPLIDGADPVRFIVTVVSDDPAALASLSTQPNVQCSETQCVWSEDLPGLPATFVNMDAIEEGRVTDDWSEFRAAIDSCRTDSTD